MALQHRRDLLALLYRKKFSQKMFEECLEACEKQLEGQQVIIAMLSESDSLIDERSELAQILCHKSKVMERLGKPLEEIMEVIDEGIGLEELNANLTGGPVSQWLPTLLHAKASILQVSDG